MFFYVLVGNLMTNVIDRAATDDAATEATEVLKTLSNPSRLRILCKLLEGEHSVGELEEALGASQSYVSGQLARMRSEGLVGCTREGRVIRYRIADQRLQPVLDCLADVFCDGKPVFS